MYYLNYLLRIYGLSLLPLYLIVFQQFI